MAREILFKAKRKDWRELPKEEWWVEGYPIKYPSGKVEIHEKCIEPPDILKITEIAPETLCQYTGRNDKNGKRIWENDIARIRSFTLSGYGTICYENGCLVLKDRKRKRMYDMFWEWDIRVDGNIFDNPELLGGAE